MRTANLAIVFTEIHGFTERTSRQTLEQNQQLLTQNRELLAPLFEAFGGKVVKAIGDAFLVTFESPTQAVLSGLAIQDRLWAHNRQAPEAAPLEVRISVNVGEVRLEAKDIFGEPVNIAARVEAVAKPGDVYFTEAVYLSMNKAEVPAEEVGLFELKGIPGKIKVFRVPRSAFRLEALGGGSEGLEDQPPFGNLGLSRVAEKPPAAQVPEPHPAAIRAASLMRAGLERLQLLAPRVFGGRTKAWLAVPVGVGLLLVALALTSGRAPVDAAIEDVVRAAPAERELKLQKARQLIAELRDPAASELAQGKLDEAVGSAARAVRHYVLAAEAGSAGARSRLLELLESPQCRTRVAAAEAAGELKLGVARGRLEHLAEHGGPDEGLDIPIIGCNSKRAAAGALRRLP